MFMPMDARTVSFRVTKNTDVLSEARGFTLIEVLIALVILSIVILPLIKLSIQSAERSMHMQRYLKAQFMMQSVYHELKHVDSEQQLPIIDRYNTFLLQDITFQQYEIMLVSCLDRQCILLKQLDKSIEECIATTKVNGCFSLAISHITNEVSDLTLDQKVDEHVVQGLL